MRRREFITLLGGADGRHGLFCGAGAEEPEVFAGSACSRTHPRAIFRGELSLAAFEQALKSLGWSKGQNIHIDYRLGVGDAARMAAFAKELVAIKPDVIVARSTPALKALAAETKTIPIVFIGVSDPVGEGLAASLAAARRKRHRIYQCGIRDGRQMGRIAQRNYARP